jgi:hypothetical protein
LTQRIAASDAHKLFGKPKRRNKFNAKRVTVNGRTYDSEAEARYCEGLILREKAGEIGGLEFQRRFQVLGPKGELVCTYKADAAFWDHTEDRFRVVDVKGVETDVFKLKKKMMRAFLGIEVEVIKA